MLFSVPSKVHIHSLVMISDRIAAANCKLDGKDHLNIKQYIGQRIQEWAK